MWVFIRTTKKVQAAIRQNTTRKEKTYIFDINDIFLISRKKTKNALTVICHHIGFGNITCKSLMVLAPSQHTLGFLLLRRSVPMSKKVKYIRVSATDMNIVYHVSGFSMQHVTISTGK